MVHRSHHGSQLEIENPNLIIPHRDHTGYLRQIQMIRNLLWWHLELPLHVSQMIKTHSMPWITVIMIPTDLLKKVFASNKAYIFNKISVIFHIVLQVIAHKILRDVFSKNFVKGWPWKGPILLQIICQWLVCPIRSVPVVTRWTRVVIMSISNIGVSIPVRSIIINNVAISQSICTSSDDIWHFCIQVWIDTENMGSGAGFIEKSCVFSLLPTKAIDVKEATQKF